MVNIQASIDKRETKINSLNSKISKVEDQVTNYIHIFIYTFLINNFFRFLKTFVDVSKYQTLGNYDNI